MNFRRLTTEQLSEAYGMLQRILESAGQIPNGPEKAAHVAMVEGLFMEAEKVLLEVINRR